MYIKILDLLNLHNLKIQLPSYLYDIDISSVFKEASLVCKENIYEFTKDNAVLTINPDNVDELIKIIYYSDYGRNTKIVYTEDQELRYN
ncbi:MAG: hypothetical protein E7Z80_06050 [Methanobrevibacter thaueri]|nr:hypothetical protein [Methanobrevibacter thaueri]